MEIQKKREGNQLTLALDGRLDTMTSKGLEAELHTALDGVQELIFDLDKLTFITSAGLRVLAVAQKVMKRQGHMCIINCHPDVKEVFDMTGLTNVLEIE